MKPFARVVVALCLCAIAWHASAQATPAASATQQVAGVPLTRLVAIVAKKTGKKFIIDPRVRAEVFLVGQEPADVSYSDLLTILSVHGFAAVDDGGYVQVVPDATVRQIAVPTITSKDNRPASEIVSELYTVKSVSAAQLVPFLRPLMPQYAHLAAYSCSNTLLLVDTFANVRRIEGIIRSLDTGEPYKPLGCQPKEVAAPNESPTRP